MTVKNWTKEQLENIVNSSFSYAECFRKLGDSALGSHYITLKNHLKKHNIDTSHFTGQAHGTSGKKNRKNVSYYLVENSTATTNKVKKKIIRENILPYQCNWCGITDQWNGKKLVLQLDHINGISNDHRLDNLRFLCPNCHSQTDTYCGRNITPKPNQRKVSNNLCLDCEAPIDGYSKRCNSCEVKNRKNYKITWLPTEELIQMVSKDGYRSVGRLLGVSDNAVRKRIQNHPIVGPERLERST